MPIEFPSVEEIAQKPQVSGSGCWAINAPWAFDQVRAGTFKREHPEEELLFWAHALDCVRCRQELHKIGH